ncbi:CaiB/BaiF CoA transferase family protein [Deinococcus malanensis]|uniref:CaiB/BaiF CoA transferase family protein n=1 Tax=Deinococcus malanensis TaxID=1706855 RepID=UPI003634F567
MLPLEGLRVITLEQAVAGPFCSRQLADLGADVIKIERPGEGDLARGYDGALDGVSAYFAWLNRGKRSVVLDLKSPEGVTALEALLAGADVFVHNLLPGAVERLGFGWDTVRERFPRLIWVSISGYGLSGSYAHKKAYDMLIQAEAGVVSLTGSADEPAKVGISVADIASGLYAHSSILAALLTRGRTGQGDRIEISMFEALTEWMMPPMYSLIGLGRAPGRAGLRHNMIVPYGAYRCADGQVMFAVQNEREWVKFCAGVLEQPDLASDERYATNQARLTHRQALEGTIETAFGSLTRGSQ